MKIALVCDSLLLNKSLEMYLKPHLTNYKLCDFVVATQPIESNKPVFFIGNAENAHLKIPFTKEILLQKLESFFASIKADSMQQSDIFLQPKQQIQEIQTPNITNSHKTHTLEHPIPQELHAKLEETLRNYTREIERIIGEYYKGSNG